MQIFLRPSETHALRHQRDSLLQGEIRRPLRHLFPGYRARHLPPCPGTVSQTHRDLASYGSRDQSQTVARTNLPPFLQRYRPNVPVQSETDSGTRKAQSHKLKLIHWGPDLPFYDHLLAEMPDRKPEGFISTGKENRDVDTLLQAFAATNEKLDLYIAVSCGNINYKKIIDPYALPDSIRIHYTDGVIPYELGKLVARKSCIVICCLDFPYTVGLTTLVEAFALGIPVICSRNPNFEIDIDKEGIGITVEYNDVQGWIDAIRYIADHPEEARRMGENARKLAEERFNLEIFSREIAESLLEISNISSKNRTFA